MTQIEDPNSRFNVGSLRGLINYVGYAHLNFVYYVFSDSTPGLENYNHASESFPTDTQYTAERVVLSSTNLHVPLAMDIPVVLSESRACTVSTTSFSKLSSMLVVSAIEYPVTMTSPAQTSISTITKFTQSSDRIEGAVKMLEPRSAANAKNVCVPSSTEEHISNLTSYFPEVSVTLIGGSAVATLQTGSTIQERYAEFVAEALPTTGSTMQERYAEFMAEALPTTGSTMQERSAEFVAEALPTTGSTIQERSAEFVAEALPTPGSTMQERSAEFVPEALPTTGSTMQERYAEFVAKALPTTGSTIQERSAEFVTEALPTTGSTIQERYAEFVAEALPTTGSTMQERSAEFVTEALQTTGSTMQERYAEFVAEALPTTGSTIQERYAEFMAEALQTTGSTMQERSAEFVAEALPTTGSTIQERSAEFVAEALPTTGSTMQERYAEFVALPTEVRLPNDISLTMEPISLSEHKAPALGTTIYTAISESAVNVVETMAKPSLFTEHKSGQRSVLKEQELLSENEEPLSLSTNETNEDVIDYTGM